MNFSDEVGGCNFTDLYVNNRLVLDRRKFFFKNGLKTDEVYFHPSCPPEFLLGSLRDQNYKPIQTQVL